MYDFYYGSKSKIYSNKIKYLIFLKHMLPRWLNSIPDNEFISIWYCLKNIKVKKPTIIETGTGCSTIALLFYSILTEGKLISWDTNQNKGSELKKLFTETLGKNLGVDINKYWKFIPYDSLDPNVGIPCLKELKLKPSFGFFDSFHTSTHLLNEVSLYCELAANKFIVAIDDSYYTNKNYNYAYINMIRKKLDLKLISEPKSNIGNTYYDNVENKLLSNYKKVRKIKDTFKLNFKNDIFYEYYESDRAVMQSLKMVKLDSNKQRFDAWEVKKY